MGRAYLVRFNTKGLTGMVNARGLERFSTLGVTGQVSGFLGAVEEVVVLVASTWSLVLGTSVVRFMCSLGSVGKVDSLCATIPVDIDTDSARIVVAVGQSGSVLDDFVAVVSCLVVIIFGLMGFLMVDLRVK